jgi:hypothetical protein
MNLIKREIPQKKNGILHTVGQLFAGILYPFVLIFGLIFMILAALISFWQRLTITKSELENERNEETESLVNQKEWLPFISIKNINIESQFVGSLPWDSGDYLYLNGDPEILYLTDKLFGDWIHIALGGVFIQRWNNASEIICDLIYIDSDSLQVIELQKQIPSKNWKSENIDPDTVMFTFTTSKFELIYRVNLEEINKQKKCSVGSQL